MTNSIFDRFSSTDTASVRRKQRKQKQGRILRIEELENRELLSATLWETGLPMPSSSSSSWDDSTDASTQVVVSSASVSASAATPVLEVPTGLTVVGVSTDSITLRWDAVEGAIGYEVRSYGLLGNVWSTRILPVSEALIVLTGLNEDTAYTNIQVRAVFDSGVSDYSERIDTATLGLSHYRVGANVVSVSHDAVTLAWNTVIPRWNTDTVVVYYEIQDFARTDLFVTTDSSLTITGLADNTHYSFRMRVVATNGTDTVQTGWHSLPGVSTPRAPIFVPTPTGLSVSVGTTANHIAGRSAVVTWNTVENATAYIVQYRVQGTDTWSSQRISASATSTTFTSLTPGTTYEFRIRVEHLDGWQPHYSEWSNSVWATAPTTTALSTTVADTWGGSVWRVGTQLQIQGTNGNDWIEIQQTSTSIIVHSFCDQRIDRTGVWSVDRNGISQIAFWGYGGNDVFIGAYEGVSTTIAMRLDGGGGDNWLVGGAGNDWIYGGWLGNSHLDTGVSGDSMVIGGRGANVFYNSSAGSDMFIGAGTDTWADGHSLGSTDGQLRMRMSGGTGHYGLVFRAWSEAEVIRISTYVQQTYSLIGNYKLFTSSSGGAIVCGISNSGSVLGYADTRSFVAFRGMTTYSTFIHEVAHLWHDTSNPVWNDFRSISWASGTSRVSSDFASWYGSTNSLEDWAETLAVMVVGRSIHGVGGSSAKWHQKVATVHQFFAYLNPNYMPGVSYVSTPGHSTPHNPSTPTTPTNPSTPQNPTAPPAVKPKVRLDKKATTTTSLTINLLAPNSRTSLDANASYTIHWNSTGRNSGLSNGVLDGFTGTQLVLTDLLPGVRYRIQITPHNEDGHTNYDKKGRLLHTVIHATTQRYDTLRVQKLRSDNSLRTAASLTFTWQQSRAKHVADAVIHYRVEILDRTTGQTVMQTTTTDLRFTLTELDANTRYTLRVQEVATIDGRDILSRIAQLTARTLRLV